MLCSLWTVAAPLKAPDPVLTSGRLIVGTNDDIYPYVYSDNQQKPVGLVIDLWHQLANTAGLTLEIRVLPRVQLATALANGDIDVVAGLSRNPEREQQYLLGPTLVNVYSNVFVHRDLNNVNQLQQLKPYLIGALQQSANSVSLRQAVPGLIVREFALQDDLYNAALNGELRAFTAQDRLSPRFDRIKELQEQFPLYRKLPLQKIELTYAILRNRPALAAHLGQAYAALPEGFVEKLERRWLSGISDENTVLVAMAEGNPPLMNVTPNGLPQGLLVDLWQLWSDQTGIPIAMVPETTTEGLKTLRQGRVDAHMGFPVAGKTPEGVRQVWPVYRLMSSFYYSAGQKFTDITQVSLPIGVFAAASYVEKLRQDYPVLQIRSFEKLEEMVRAFERNEISGFFISDLVMQHRVLQTNANAYKKLEQPRYQTELQVLVSADDNKLADKLRQGFQAITQDQLETIEKRWLARPETGFYNSFRQQVPLSPQAQEWLKNHHSIRVGVMANWPPMEFVDQDGVFKGVTQDILTKLNQRLGTELVAVPYFDWQLLVQDFLDGKLDMIANMADTPERKKQANFSLNFWPSQWALLSLGHTASVASMRELSGSSVAIEKDYDINLLLQQQFPEIKIVPTSHYDESLELLQQGQVNYAIDTLMVTGGTLRKPEYSNLRMHLPADMPVTPSLFAVRKDYPLLLQIIDQGLRTLSEADRTEIRNRWFLLDFDPDLAQDRVYTLVLQVVGAGLLLFAVVFFWNMSLRREVGLRREMEQKMRFMATHDDLTQLANRALLQERLEQAVMQHARHQEKLALLFIDLDGFKAVNDSFGHDVGDELLTRVAAMLKYCVRKSDTVARFGGDEFVVLLTGLLDRDDAAIVAEKILLQLAEPVQLSVSQVKVGASIGIALYPDDGIDSNGLLKSADSLMYLAKQSGKGQYRFSR